MGTHATRDHPKVEDIAGMNDRDLAAYVKRELDFLSSEEQRRIPLPVRAALDEFMKRARKK